MSENSQSHKQPCLVRDLVVRTPVLAGGTWYMVRPGGTLKLLDAPCIEIEFLTYDFLGSLLHLLCLPIKQCLILLFD